MANNYEGWHNAQFYCKEEAKKLARFGTPEFPRLFYFGTFNKGEDYATSGIAVLHEKEARYQNAFGAMAHVRVTCRYNLRTKNVIDVSVIEP
jgi:hypothetical protein